MKKLLVSMLIIFPIIGISATTSFKCQSLDQLGVHKFDAHGVVNLANKNKITGLISIKLEKAQAAQSVQNYENVSIVGYIRHFEAGDIVEETFDQLVVTTSEPYLKSLNLLLGFHDKATSKVFSIDNFLYRSNCKFND